MTTICNPLFFLMNPLFICDEYLSDQQINKKAIQSTNKLFMTFAVACFPTNPHRLSWLE